MRKYSHIAQFNAEAKKIERERINDEILDKQFELIEKSKQAQDKILFISSQTLQELRESSELSKKSYKANIAVLIISLLSLIISIFR